VITSRYGGRSSSPFTGITISDDSLQVRLVPSWKFFSNDTIACRFTGFSSTYSYTGGDNLPGPSASGSYSWTVYTGVTGFYTFPNPYRPSKDPRHCGGSGPCGVVFKNLHVIRRGVDQVRIRIFNIRSVPVYDSRLIRFEPESSTYKPQWVWNTRNEGGQEVSSGVYYYAVYDEKDRVLLRGKLMIVR